MDDERYVPQRRCIACRNRFPQETLIKVTDSEEGLRLGQRKHISGRSCYICRKQECISRSFAKNLFAASLRHSVSKEELSALKEEIEKML